MTDRNPLGIHCTICTVAIPCRACQRQIDAEATPDASTHTYWLSIGRNVGDEPIEHYAWQAFKLQLGNIVADAGGNVITTVEGASDWQGQAEDTYLILATIPSNRIGQLRRWLETLATAWGQEAIGLVGGCCIADPDHECITGDTLVWSQAGEED